MMYRSLLLVILATVLKSVFVYGQAPTVKIKETDPHTSSRRYITARRDKDVVMDCFVENLPATTVVRWQRTYRHRNGTTGVLALSQDMALEDNIQYSIEKPRQFTWRLRIRSIQVNHEGTYQCYVLTNQNSRAEDHRVISVVYPPFLDLQQTSSDMTVDAGTDVTLMCNASARPPATIEWTRLGGALLPIGQEKKLGSKLQIHEIKADDRGVYRCTAVNSIASTIRDINVNIRFAPVVKVNKDVEYQAVGYRIELQCFGEGNPVPQKKKSYWTRGGAPLSSSSDEYEQRFLQGAFGQVTYELIFFNVQEALFGEYTCHIGNDQGIGSNSLALAEVETPRKSIKLGRIIPAGDTAASTQSLSLLLFSVAALLPLISRTVQLL